MDELFLLRVVDVNTGMKLMGQKVTEKEKLKWIGLGEWGQGRGDRKNGARESSGAGSADWRLEGKEGLASFLLLCFHSAAFNKSRLGISAGLDATGGHLIGLAMDKCSSQWETGAIAWWKPTLSADRLANNILLFS